MSTLRRLRGSQRYPKAQFQLEITDALLDFSPGFQPHAVYVSVTRHGKEYLSQSVKWEASLKSPQSGLCLWHPPFQCVIEISIPPESALKSGGGSGSGPEDIHKDAFVSLYNTVPGKKGKVKLLAKSRIDLFEYRDQVDKSIFKMKLLPETKKVKKSTINVSILNGTKLQMQRKAQEDLDTVMGHVGVQSKGMASRKSLDLASDGAHSLSKSLHSLDPLENLSTSSPAQESSNVSDISAPFVLSAGSRKSVDLNLKDLQKALPKIEQDSAAVTKAQSMEGNLDKNPVTPSGNETVLLGPSPFVRAYTPSAATKNLNLSPPPTQKTTASMEDIFDSVTDKILDSPVHHSKPLFSAKPTPLQQNDTPSMGRISSRFSEKDKDILQWSKKALKKYPQVSLYTLISELGKIQVFIWNLGNIFMILLGIL